MKLYGTPFAPNPRRVLWTLAEKGIEDVEIVPVDLNAGAHRQPEFLELAGVPQVPQLELDDGTVIGESIAICRYLEALHPEPNLFGRDPLETARIETWTRRAEQMFATPLMLAVRFGHPGLAAVEPNQSPERAAAHRRNVEAALPLFERQLTGRTWLCGERLTIADIVAGCSVGFARLIKFEFGEQFPELSRWSRSVMARPGAKPAR